MFTNICLAIALTARLASCAPHVFSIQTRATGLQKRDSDYISSCGPEWVPIDDFKTGDTSYIGYKTAVSMFCADVEIATKNATVLMAAGDFWVQTVSQDDNDVKVGLDGGKNPSTNGFAGQISFEIHNKLDHDYAPDGAACVDHLMKMATKDSPGDNCYGDDNKDTKGGTWQIGSDDVSYHALAGRT